MKDQEKSQFSIKLEKIYAQYDADKKEASSFLELLG